jgi:hypothetical protein
MAEFPQRMLELLAQFREQHPDAPIRESKRLAEFFDGPARGPIIDSDDDDVPPTRSHSRRAPSPPPIHVAEVVEHFVPLEVQINDFAVSRARIMLAEDMATLKEQLVGLFDFCARVKGEMRESNAQIGLNLGYYVVHSINSVQVPNCLIPNFVRDPFVVEVIRAIYDKGGEPAQILDRFSFECLIELEDTSLQKFNPQLIVVPNREVFAKMIQRLGVVLNQYPDTPHLNNPNYVQDKMRGISQGRQEPINEIWQLVGWRNGLGVDEKPCMLNDLFMDL